LVNNQTEVSVVRSPENVFDFQDGRLEADFLRARSAMTINSIDLVPGDLILVSDDLLMPCDAILLTGSAIMNESMLTGESISVLKSPL
jgi:P-type E1-E2 ATPase